MNNKIQIKMWGQQIFVATVKDNGTVWVNHMQWERYCYPNMESHICMNANSAKYGRRVSSYSGGYTQEFTLVDHRDNFDKTYQIPEEVETTEDLVNFIVEELADEGYTPKRRNGISWDEVGEELPRYKMVETRSRVERGKVFRV